MIYLGFAIAYVGGFAVAAHLIINDHPVFGFFFFVATASLNVGQRIVKGEKNDAEN